MRWLIRSLICFLWLKVYLYDFYEVKNASNVYGQFVKDAGIRYYILNRCKVKIGNIFIVTHGLDEDNLFVLSDITAEAKSYLKWIDDNL